MKGANHESIRWEHVKEKTKLSTRTIQIILLWGKIHIEYSHNDSSQACTITLWHFELGKDFKPDTNIL